MTALMFLTKAGQICSDVRQVSCSIPFRCLATATRSQTGPIERAAADWPVRW
jgi:hypothetical protein